MRDSQFQLVTKNGNNGSGFTALMLLAALFLLWILSSCSSFQHALVLSEPYKIMECRQSWDRTKQDSVYVCKIVNALDQMSFSFVTFEEIPTDSVLVFSKVVHLDHRWSDKEPCRSATPQLENPMPGQKALRWPSTSEP